MDRQGENQSKGDMERTSPRLVTLWGYTAGSLGRMVWGDLSRTLLLQLESA